MARTHTYTLAKLEIPQVAYDMIIESLRKVSSEHVDYVAYYTHDVEDCGGLDLHGILLVPNK